jgi:hypothetical protein
MHDPDCSVPQYGYTGGAYIMTLTVNRRSYVFEEQIRNYGFIAGCITSGDVTGAGACRTICRRH